MRTIHRNQNVQLPTQEHMIVTDVSSNFSQLIDGMQGTVEDVTVVYDEETHCWWDKAVKAPARLQDLWSIARSMDAMQPIAPPITVEMGHLQALPAVGTRVRVRAVIDRYPLFYYDYVGVTGTVTQSGDKEIWVRMDLPVWGLEPEWENQLIIDDEALSGEGNNGVKIATMAELFALFFEPIEGEL